MASKRVPQSKYALCNGLRLHYLDWGNPSASSGQAEPLILLHGIHGHAHAWDDFAEAIADDFRVIALDLRGHGDSEWSPQGAYTVEDYVADLSAFTTGLGIVRSNMIGLSLGGVIAIAFAALNPDQVKRLVIVDIGPDIAPRGIEHLRQGAQARPAVFADMDEAIRWVSGGEAPKDEGEFLRSLQHRLRPAAGGGFEWKYDPAVDRIIRPGAPRDPGLLWQLWGSIECPTLLVRGENSDLLAPETAVRMAQTNPRAMLVEIPGAGHAVLEDSPEGFRRAVTAFIVQDVESLGHGQ